MQAVVAGLATTVVKSTRLRPVERIALGRGGARGDRRFFMIDSGDRLVNAKRVGELPAIIATYDEPTRTLALTFPDGRVVEDRVELGEAVTARFTSITVDGRVVTGRLSEALSEFVGRPLRLVEPDVAGVDRGIRGAASLISRASLLRLAKVAGQPNIDGRRFRMLIEIDGVGAHEEDRWVGRVVAIGEVRLRFLGHVGRCLITSRDPDTGNLDLPTLDVLGTYRRAVKATEPLPFGIYGEVLREGTIAVGDPVELLDPEPIELLD